MQTIEESPRIRKGLVVDFGGKGVGIHSDVYLDEGLEVKFLILNKEYDFKLKGGAKLQLNGGMQNIFNSYQNDFDKGTFRDSKYIYGPSLPRSLTFGLKIMI